MRVGEIFENRALSMYRPKEKAETSEELADGWKLLLFYPLDFTFVCPTEVQAFSDAIGEFEKRKVSVYGVSVDSVHTHRAWASTPRAEGGVEGLTFPLVSDLTKELSEEFGVLHDGGMSLRGMYILDPENRVRVAHVNDFPLGRSVDEALRLVDALQFNAEHGDGCPAGWRPGKATLGESYEGSRKYFSEHP